MTLILLSRLVVWWDSMRQVNKFKERYWQRRYGRIKAKEKERVVACDASKYCVIFP